MKKFSLLLIFMIISSIIFVVYYVFNHKDDLLKVEKVKEQILILGAMEEEVAALVEEISDKQEIKILGQTVYFGILNDKNVIVANTGIGLVSASAITSAIIQQYNPKYAVFSGVAGSLNQELNIGDIVVATDTVEYNFDATAFGYKLGQIPRIDVYSFVTDNELNNKIKKLTLNLDNFKLYFNRIISADKFVSSKDEKIRLGDEFNAFAVDMESSAFSQVCYLSKTPCVVIRSISDTITDESVMEYSEFVPIAVKNNIKIIKELLSN